MAIPKVFQSIKKQDFTLTPITVHKKYVIQRDVNLYSGNTPVTESGYKLWNARYFGEKLKLSSSVTYPTNSWDGSNQYIIWNSIDAQYYRFPYDRGATFEHSNERFTYKFLGFSASIISIPEMDFGESIKPGSVEITASSIHLKDDGNGNLYDTSITTSSFSDRNKLIAHWEFDHLYRGMKLPASDHYWQYGNRDLPYESHIFSPDKPSRCNNIKFSERLLITNDVGLSVYFESSSIITDSRPEFNPTADKDFAITFWMSQSNFQGTGSLLTKRGTIYKQTYGNQEKYNQNDSLINSYHISSSYIDQETDIYPYDFQLYGTESIRFKRSDGINSIQLDMNVSSSNGDWLLVGLIKSGSHYSLYKNTTLFITGSNRALGNCNNDHCLIFGSLNQALKQPLNGKMNEIRFYDTGSLNVGSLLYQTHQHAVVGNVFYRKGIITLSTLASTYMNIINSDFTLRFRGTHTIYQYETLIRIPMGSFNLSQNPSARQNPYTDLIINDMTGSLDDGALFPYATSIGLYNEKAELMAVAKLSQPLAMRDDVDLNILVRFDA